MKAVGLISMVLALCAGFFYYDGYFTSTPGAASPKQEIDLISVNSDLQTRGQAERQYQAAHSSYGWSDEITEADLLRPAANRRGYTVTASVNGNQGFTITAAPSDPQKTDWPTLSINETLEITSR